MNKGLTRLVRDRAAARCEYCGLPEALSNLPHEIDHVIARQHGGPTEAGNLALSCGFCNAHKGPNLAGIDPAAGAMTRLFNPRTDAWDDHFAWNAAAIVGRTAIGRATVVVLDLNGPLVLAIRQALMDEGKWDTA